MSFYEKNLVVEEAKVKTLQTLTQYDAGLVTMDLGWAFYVLVKTRASKTESTQSATLDRVINSTFPYERATAVNFYGALETKAQIGPLRPRWLNGTKDLSRMALNSIVLSELQELTYPQKINTWAAICEEWLHMSNIDWVAKGSNWLYDDPPTDEEEIMRWIPRWVSHIHWLY